MRRNKDGTRNLTDLRAALAKDPNVSVRYQGGGWIIGIYSESMRAIVETPCHYSTDERAAIETALRLDT